MTHYQTSAIRSNYGWRQNRTIGQKIEEIKGIGTVSKSVLAILVILILGLVYVSETSKAGSLAEPINEMEAKVSSLKEKNQSLSVEVARMQSLKEIEKSAVAGTLTPANEVQFVD